MCTKVQPQRNTHDQRLGRLEDLVGPHREVADLLLHVVGKAAALDRGNDTGHTSHGPGVARGPVSGVDGLLSEGNVLPEVDRRVAKHGTVCRDLVVRRVEERLVVVQRAVVREERRDHVDVVGPERDLVGTVRDGAVRGLRSGWLVTAAIITSSHRACLPSGHGTAGS